MATVGDVAPNGPEQATADDEEVDLNNSDVSTYVWEFSCATNGTSGKYKVTLPRSARITAKCLKRGRPAVKFTTFEGAEGFAVLTCTDFDFGVPERRDEKVPVDSVVGQTVSKLEYTKLAPVEQKRKRSLELMEAWHEIRDNLNQVHEEVMLPGGVPTAEMLTKVKELIGAVSVANDRRDEAREKHKKFKASTLVVRPMFDLWPEDKTPKPYGKGWVDATEEEAAAHMAKA